MENSNSVKENDTLMNAYERLNNNCNKFSELERLTLKLNRKLNRTENDPICEDECMLKEEQRTKNIVDLFNQISYRLEYSYNAIGEVTERSMRMID